ncbi:MAG: ABC transporter ATP-binding protein [Nitrososphaerales archaeon]
MNASNISVEYSLGNFKKLAIDNVSFSIPSTQYTTGVVGESGSGKTTLGMSLMNMINRPGRITTGSVIYEGSNVLTMNENELRLYRWKEVSMIFQSAMNSLNPVKRAADHITEVIRDHTNTTKSDSRERALKLLSEVGIEKEHVDDYPHELSGGMRQRVVIALALALSPKLVIADEPTSALDVVVQKQILSLMRREISERGLSLVFITHDLPILAGLVDQISVMFAGEIVEQGPASKIFSEPLHPYTEALLSSLLTLDAQNTHPRSLSELRETNKPVALKGCKYQNRCKYVFERCKSDHPELRLVEGGRFAACHKYN